MQSALNIYIFTNKVLNLPHEVNTYFQVPCLISQETCETPLASGIPSSLLLKHLKLILTHLKVCQPIRTGEKQSSSNMVTLEIWQLLVFQHFFVHNKQWQHNTLLSKNNKGLKRTS